MLFSFPAGTKMFQFPALASIIRWMLSLQDNGLSHSEIRGSRVICTSPQLIAAYHVLHRLREPRHPPCALSYFPYHVHTPSFDGCGMIYTFSFRTKITFCLLHHVIDLFSSGELVRTGFACARPSSISHFVENNGFEPLTPCVQSRCSSQLS